MNFKLWLENDANKSILHQAFQKGIDKNDKSIIGFHGTSIFALLEAIKKGFLPVTSGSEIFAAGEYQKKIYGQQFENYGFHVVPNPQNDIVKKIEFRKKLISDPYSEAIRWAEYISGRHYFFDKYKMNFENPNHHAASHEFGQMMHLDDKDSEQEISKKYNLKKPKPTAIKGGVVLAISDSVANNFKLAAGGDGDDLNIITKKLPIEYIKGIEPIDDSAYEWLDDII